MKPNPFSDITIMTLTDYDIHRFYIHTCIILIFVIWDNS